MNPVVHFEMPFEDRNRMAQFYQKAFGWKVQMLGPEMHDYVVMETTEMAESGFPKEPGRINGGFFRISAEASGPNIVIATKNIEESKNKVAEAGGKLLGEIVDIPGIGKYVGFIDTEGNRVAIIQPKNM